MFDVRRLPLTPLKWIKLRHGKKVDSKTATIVAVATAAAAAAAAQAPMNTRVHSNVIFFQKITVRAL